MKNVKRFLALVLVVLLAFGNLITVVSAEEPAAEEDAAAAASLEEPAAEEVPAAEITDTSDSSGGVITTAEALPPEEPLEAAPEEEPAEEPLPEEAVLAGEPADEEMQVNEYSLSDSSDTMAISEAAANAAATGTCVDESVYNSSGNSKYKLSATFGSGVQVYCQKMNSNTEEINLSNAEQLSSGTTYYFVSDTFAGNGGVKFAVVVPAGYATGSGYSAKADGKPLDNQRFIPPTDNQYGSVTGGNADYCIGWFYYSFCNDNQNKLIAATIDVTAVQYSVAYDLNGGTGVQIADGGVYKHSAINEGNSTITVTDVTPSREGYTFKGWTLRGTETVYQAGGTIKVDDYWNNTAVVGENYNAEKKGTFTLVAAWEEEPTETEEPENGSYGELSFADLQNVPYDGEEHKPDVTHVQYIKKDSTGENPVLTNLNEGDYDVSYTYTSAIEGAREFIDVGTVTVTVTYSGSTAKESFNITPKAVTVKANDHRKTFGEKDPELTAKVTGLVGEDTVDYTIERAVGETVDTYDINVTGAAEQGNYTVSYASGTFTINALDISPAETADPTQSPTPGEGGETDPTPTPGEGEETDPTDPTNPTESPKPAARFTIAPIDDQIYTGKAIEPVVTVTDANGDVFDPANYDVVYTDNTDVGEATVTVTAKGDYTGTITGTFNIVKREVSVTSSDSVTYDGQAHGFTLTDTDASNLADGHTISFENASLGGTDAGEYLLPDGFVYTITDGEGNDVTGNYSVTVSAALYIERAAVTVTAKAVLEGNLAYGADAPAYEAEITEGTLYSEDSLEYDISCDYAKGDPVGSYPITIEGAEIQGNYAVTFVNGTLAVVPSGWVNVSVKGYDGPYDGAPHGIEITGAGADTVVTYQQVDEKGNPIGAPAETAPKATNVSGAVYNVTLSDPNMGEDFTFENVKLSITPVELAISARSETYVYDGTAKSVMLSVNGGEWCENGTEIQPVEGETVTVNAAKRTDVGTVAGDGLFTVTYGAGVLASNYTVVNSTPDSFLTITPAEITIKDGATVTYDGKDHTADWDALAAEAGGLVKGADYLVSAGVSDFTGAKTVTGSVDLIGKAAVNYTLTGDSAVTLTIEKAPLTVYTGSMSWVYDGTEKSYPGTGEDTYIVGLVNGETAAIAGTAKVTDVTAEAVPNTYEIDWGSTGENNYYIEAENLGGLTVTPAALVDADGNEAVTVSEPEDVFYNAGEQKWIPEVTSGTLPVKEDDYTVSYASAAEGFDDGDFTNAHTIRVTVAAKEGGNFTGEITREYTIKPFEVTVTTADAEKAFDGTDLTAGGFVSWAGAEQPVAIGYGADGAEPIEIFEGESFRIYTNSAIVAPSTVSNIAAQDFAETKEHTDTNYKFTVVPGSLTVTKADLTGTVTMADWTYGAASSKPVSAVEGQAEGYGTSAVKYTYYKNGVKLNGKPLSAGTYTVRATWAENSYYGEVTAEDTFTVAPRPVSITVNDASKPYGADDPVFTGTVTFLPGAGEEAAPENLSLTKVTYSRENADEAVGVYEKVLTAAVESSDFAVSELVKGDFEITKAELAPEYRIQPANTTVTYDGEAHTIGVPEAGNGDSYQYGTDGETWSDELPAFTDAGRQTVYVKVSNDSYQDYVVSAAVQINRRTVKVAAGSVSIDYGSPVPAWTAAVEQRNDETETGVLPGDSIDYKVECDYSPETPIGFYEGAVKVLVKNALSGEYENVAGAQGNYYVTIESGSLTVVSGDRQGDARIEVESYSAAYDGRPHNITVTGVTDGDSVFYSLDGRNWRDNLSELDFTDVTDGAQTVYVEVRNANYETVYTGGTVNITKAPLTVVTDDAFKTYDGTALEGTGSITGFVNGETATFTVTGSQTEVNYTDEDRIGNNTYTLVFDGTAKESNYEVKATVGTLTVLPKSLADSGEDEDAIAVTLDGLPSLTYNGLEQRQPVTVTRGGTELEPDKDYTVSYTDAKNVGTVTVTVTGAGNYTGTAYVTYNITPAALTIETFSASKLYDGTPLTAGGAVTGQQNGESITIAATGIQTAAGESDNGYDITWGEGVRRGNYVISETIGTLTVTARSLAEDANITVSDPTDFVYDGAAHQWAPIVSFRGETLARYTDYNVSYDTRDFTDAGTVTATITGAGNYRGTVTKTYRITPAALTVSTDSAAKVYDGTALTAAGRVTGLVNGETLTLNVTGSQTAVGSSRNTYSITWNGTARYSNYTVRAGSIGTLTVTAAPAPADDGGTDVTGGTPDDPTGGTPEDPADAPENPENGGLNPLTTLDEDTTPLGNTPEGDYSLTEDGTVTMDEDGTPLAGSPLGEDADCILHLLILLLALTVELYFTHSRKKHQKEEYELRSEMNGAD